MNITRIAVLGVALVAGIAAFFLMMGNEPAAPSAVQIVAPVEEKTVRVLVADRDFARGERLGLETTRWVKWPEKALSESFITEDSGTNQEELAQAVARTIIVAGEPIIEAKIVRVGSSGLLAAVLTPGMRAVTMRVNPETASGGFILPGDFVDVIYSETDEDDNSQVDTMLQNVKILAVNTIYSENPELPHIEGSNVTVELSPNDAETFVAARTSRGELSLTLRSIFEPEGDAVPERRNVDVEVIRYGRS